jgi:hypothetical protein
LHRSFHHTVDVACFKRSVINLTFENGVKIPRGKLIGVLVWADTRILSLDGR